MIGRQQGFRSLRRITAFSASALLLGSVGAAAGIPVFGAGVAYAALVAEGSSVRLSMAQSGIVIDGGAQGNITLDYPKLLVNGEGTTRKLLQATPNGKTAVLTYDGGGRIDVAADDSGTVTFTFANIPGDVKQFLFAQLIDFGYSQGGKWRIGEKEQAFPKEKPTTGPKLFQGNADTLQLTRDDGRTLLFHLPPYTYQDLQDNREWGWKIFAWKGIVPYDRNQKQVTISIVSSGAGEASPIRVDRFGQPTRVDYPGKIKSEAELKQDAVDEKAYCASLKPPATDPYGGLPGSQARFGLKKTGFFHVEEKKGRWFLTDPDGNAFFHLGVCAFQPEGDYTYVKGREQIYEWLPPASGPYQTAFRPDAGGTDFSFYLANRIRKYDKPYDSVAFTAQMIDRVRKWGFNSAGAFGAGEKAARDAARFPYVGSLPLMGWSTGIETIPGIRETIDPFDAQNRQRFDANCAKSVANSANDPLLIGWFSSNEPAHEDVGRVVPSLTGKYACKRRLVEMLREKYRTIDALKAAWEIDAASFDDLADKPLAVKTKAANADMDTYVCIFFDAYYKMLSETVHKYDPNHMLIGDRWQPGTANNEQLVRAAGKYLDVISVNYYTYGVDKSYLSRLHSWSGDKPFFLSEFYWDSPSDSGLPGGVKDVKSQAERGLAYRNYVEQVAATGFVTGVEWYTLTDGAYTGFFYGKYNGENPNCGLVDVLDRPWKTMLSQMMQANYAIYDVAYNGKPAFVYNEPRFQGTGGKKVVKIPRVTKPLTIDGRSDGWPDIPPERIGSDRLVQGADSGGVEGAFKLCWDDDYL